jgi:hypothetical protein
MAFTATKNVALAVTTTGSWPRPAWYDQSLWGRPLDTAMLNPTYREQFSDALAVVVSDPNALVRLMASRSQQSSAKATRTLSPLSQPISKPSEHQRRLRSSTAMRDAQRNFNCHHS